MHSNANLTVTDLIPFKYSQVSKAMLQETVAVSLSIDRSVN